MSAPVIPCPDCDTPLAGAARCPACDLPVTGPVAGRLWQVDQRLDALDGERTELLTERVQLLATLRSGTAPVLPAPSAPVVVPVPRPARESSPKQVQNTLLSLGALLLAVAGVVFAAVTYSHLGVVGRAAVLLALTAAAGAAPVALLRRGLTASAEALGAVAVVLALLDAYALRRTGLADGVDARSWSAVAFLVLAAGGAAWSAAVPLRVGRLAAVTAAQLPGVLVLTRLEPSLSVVAVSLVGLAALDALVALTVALPRDVRAALVGFTGLLSVVSVAVSVAAVEDDAQGAGAGFVALALLCGALATRASGTARDVLAGLAVPLLGAAAWVTVRADLTTDQEPLVGVAVALLALPVAALLPRAWRQGPVLGAGVVAAGALAAVAEPVLQALVGPVAWLADPWTLSGGSARDAVLPDDRWDGSVVTLVVLAGAAGLVLGGGLLLDRVRAATPAAAALLVLTALVLPLALATSYAGALALLLLTATAFAAAGALRREPLLLGTALVTALLAASWSVASEDATLVVLPVVAVLAAALAVREESATSVAALATGASVAAVGASRDLSVDQVGALLLAVPAACAGLSFLVRRLHLEIAAAVLATVAVGLCTNDVGWLSWSLALTGLMALGVAVRPDRRVVGLVGGLLLSASSWVRLADAGVDSPEPYVAPLALSALAFGYLRRRGTSCSSFEAYGAGLSLALVPSLLKALGDDGQLRSLLLVAVCTGVVLLAVRDRLQAPLVIGGAVLVVDALHLVGPYASALPRWSLIATAGGLLLAVGATYEQRLRDVDRLRAGFDAWA